MAKLDDIAKVAGVSRHTVARILNGRRREKWPSKQAQGDRIRRLAEEMGYKPNASARALVLGKFGCIGLVQSTKTNQSHLSYHMLSALDEGLVKHDLHLTIARLDDGTLADAEFVPKILREWLCDGLIINYHNMPGKVKKLIYDLKIPAVWLNSKMEHDACYSDDVEAMTLAMDHLLENGHRRIAYADATYHLLRRSGPLHYNKIDRLATYQDAAEKQKIKPMFIHDDEKTVGRHFLHSMTDALSGSERVTAVVCFSNVEARAIRFLAAEMGLKVPQDLSMISFRGEGLPPEPMWDDTALIAPGRGMSIETVELAVLKIAQPQVEFPSKILPFSMHLGNTVGKRRG